MPRLHWVLAGFLLAGLACGSGEAPREVATAAVAPDLCAEHGVLEAVCTRCNPSLIPVFQAKGDWCGEHGFAMSFCPVHHPERGGRPAGEVGSDGAPAHGTKIRFQTRETAELAGLLTAQALLAPDEGGVEAVARLGWDATRQATVGARAAGVVQSVRVDVGTAVRAGDTLCVVQSATASADRAGAEAARSRVALAERTLERKRALDAYVSRAELALAEQDVADALAALRSAEIASGYAVTAPIAGVVTRRDVTLGAGVEAGAPLFEIVDPSRMWAEVDVPEREAGLVRPGQAVAIAVDFVGERAGVVEHVSPSIDPRTRTLRARVGLDNADGALRANMFGAARVGVGGDREVVVVPDAAVQRAGGVDVVFVKLAIDEYETRRVRVLRRQGDAVHVAGGVSGGEEVVTQGSFLLKTEILKDSIGAGCCDVE